MSNCDCLPGKAGGTPVSIRGHERTMRAELRQGHRKEYEFYLDHAELTQHMDVQLLIETLATSA